jgi:hypothetical protein
MRAQEAMTALEEALRVERIPYPKERIAEALRALRRG